MAGEVAEGRPGQDEAVLNNRLHAVEFNPSV